MPKETERQIRTETEYISRNGQIYKKVTIYSIVGGATFRVDDDDSPTVEEFKNVVLHKDNNSNKDGYVSSKS